MMARGNLCWPLTITTSSDYIDSDETDGCHSRPVASSSSSANMALELRDLKWKIRDLDDLDKQIMELRQTLQKR